MKKTIVFDFDGVIHKGYTGWKDGSIYGEIDMELLQFIEELLKNYYVVIGSNRPAKQIVECLTPLCNVPVELFYKDMKDNLYWQKDGVIGVTNEKAVGFLYVDDRAIRYSRELPTEENIKFIKQYLE